MVSNEYSIICLVINIIIWYFTYRLCKRKNPKFCISTTTIFCFLFFSVVSLLLFVSQNFWTYDIKYENITLFPLVYLFFMIICSIYPLIKYDSIKTNRIQLPSITIIEVFLLLYGVSSLAILPYIYSNIESGMVMLLVENQGSELYRMRNEMEAMGEGVYRFPRIIEYIKQYHGRLSDLSIFMTAVYCLYKQKNKFLIYIIVLSVVIDIVEPLSQGLRTNVIMKIWAIVAVSCLFYRFFDNRLKRILKRISILLAVIISVPFLALTVSRFGDRDQSGGTLGTMINYMGQANLNFDMYGLDAGGIRYGDRTASVIKGWIVGEKKDMFTVREQYENLKIDDAHYYTYVGDFTLDFGPVVAVFIFLVVLFLYQNFVVPHSRTVKVHEMCLLYLLATICLQGAMYLFYYSYSWNWRVIYAVLFSIIFAYDYKANQKNRTIYAYDTTNI